MLASRSKPALYDKGDGNVQYDAGETTVDDKQAATLANAQTQILDEADVQFDDKFSFTSEDEEEKEQVLMTERVLRVQSVKRVQAANLVHCDRCRATGMDCILRIKSNPKDPTPNESCVKCYVGRTSCKWSDDTTRKLARHLLVESGQKYRRAGPHPLVSEEEIQTLEAHYTVRNKPPRGKTLKGNRDDSVTKVTIPTTRSKNSESRRKRPRLEETDASESDHDDREHSKRARVEEQSQRVMLTMSPGSFKREVEDV
ncbi:hypothetical protein FRC17_008367, partial [Serendipita sp. 399]